MGTWRGGDWRERSRTRWAVVGVHDRHDRVQGGVDPDSCRGDSIGFGPLRRASRMRLRVSDRRENALELPRPSS